MSNVTIIQTYDEIYMGSDSAVSGIVNDKLYRIGDKGEKIFQFDDKLIFCSGDLKLSYKIIEEFSKSDHTIKALQNIAKNSHIGEPLDILVATFEDYKSIVCQISPYNNFEIIKRTVDKNNFAIWAGGIKTEESCSVAYELLSDSKPIKYIYQTVFDEISFEGVGGYLSLYKLDRNEIKLIYKNTIKEKPNLNRIHENLVVAETVVGKLGVFAKLRSDQIVVGNDNVETTLDNKFNGFAPKVFANGLMEITDDKGFVAYKDATKQEFTQLYPDGLYQVKKVGDTEERKEYFYLAYQGNGEIIGNSFEGVEPSPVTIQLPDDFKGKNFTVQLGIRESTVFWSDSVVNSWKLEVTSIDYANARFTVAGNMNLTYYFLDGTQEFGYYLRRDTTRVGMKFNYTAMA